MSGLKQKNGFTIVELLIVIVVIAILAAITIVSYNGIQNRAKISIAQNNLTEISKQLEVYKVDNGVYPSSSQNSVWLSLLAAAAGDVTSTQTFVLCRIANGSVFGVAAWTPVYPRAIGDTYYYITSASGSVLSKSWPGQGGYGTVAAAVCADIGLPSTGASWSQQI